MVLRTIFAGSGHSRSQLAEETGLSAMAITRIIRELIRANLVKEVGKRDREGHPGRRQMDIQIQPTGAYVLGAVISAYGHEVAVMNAAGETLVRRKVVIDDIRDAHNTIEVISDAIGSLVDSAQINRELVLGIGVAIAALVDNTTGMVDSAPILGWQNVPLGTEIERLTGHKVHVDSIANATNLTEQSIGAVRDHRDVFLVHNSTTCGASYAQRGIVNRGANNSMGQVGHLPTRSGSLVCSCGANDCLDTHATGWSVLVHLGRINSKRFQPEDVEAYAIALSKLVAEKHPPGSAEYEAIHDAGWHLGQALITVCSILDPHAIVLSGQMSKLDAYEAGCRSAWSEQTATRLRKLPELIVGQISPLQAAAFLALDTRLYSPDLDIDYLLEKSVENQAVSV